MGLDGSVFKEEGRERTLLTLTKYDFAGLYAILNSVDVQNPFVFWRFFQGLCSVKTGEGGGRVCLVHSPGEVGAGLSIYDPEDMGISNITVVSEVIESRCWTQLRAF